MIKKFLAAMAFCLTTTASMAQANNGPSFTDWQSNVTAKVGQTLEHKILVEDGENDPVKVILANEPTGMMFDPETNTVIWKPTEAGTVTFTVTITDEKEGVGFHTIGRDVTVTVNP